VIHSKQPRLSRLLLPVLFAATAIVAADTPASAAKPKQFIYVLRLVPRLHDDRAWTEADTKTVASHFAHLKAATEAGQVILAGRTLEPGSKTFGLVVFEAADEAAARTFMESDPALLGQIMTATMHPYQIALQRGANR